MQDLLPFLYILNALEDSVNTALRLSAVGIYLHAISIAIVIGGGVTALTLEFVGNVTRDREYIETAKKVMKAVAVAFTFGAISGTMVEFGLVQVWNGVLLAIAAWVLIPLYLELIAFILEGALVLGVIYTWDRIKNPWIHWVITLLFVFGSLLSGALITSVNAWMQAPWGVGNLVQLIYPWAPVYGPSVSNINFLIELKEALVNATLSGEAGSKLVTPTIIDQLVKKYGSLLSDPWIALKSPYAMASITHQLLAASLVGISWVGAGLAIRGLKEKNGNYFKVFKVVAILGAILLIIQGIEGHEMGMAVLTYQPTKFAMIAGLYKSGPDPIVGLTAFGDPNHIFTGFDKLLEMAENHPHANIKIAGVSLRDIAVRDTLAAESKLPLVHTLYMIKIGLAGIGILVALIFLSLLISKSFWERHTKVLFELGILFGILMPSIAGLGWAVREIGRKPWTVYGLLYPSELITSININPLIATIVIGGLITAFIVMVYTMYVVLTREIKIFK